MRPTISVRLRTISLQVATCLALVGQPVSSPTRDIVVVFRYDDYSSVSATQVERRLVEAFRQRSLRCTFSVVPFVCAETGMNPQKQRLIPLEAEKLQILREGISSGTIEVALHGYSHQTIRKWGYFSEFSGLDYTSQMLRLKAGKAFLEKQLGVRVDTFVAPFDTFDRNTVEALEAEGFEVLSPNLNEPMDLPRQSKLKFLPVTCGISGAGSALRSARILEEQQVAVVILLHPYDFVEASERRGKISLPDLEGLLDWIGGQPDMRVVSIDQATTLMKDLSAERILAFNDRWALRLVPPLVQSVGGFPVGTYYKQTPGLSVRLWTSVAALYLVIGASAMIPSFVLAKRLTRWSAPMASLSRYCSLVICFAFIAYDLRNWVIKYEGAVVIAILSGVSIGVWAVAVRLGKIGRTHGP